MKKLYVGELDKLFNIDECGWIEDDNTTCTPFKNCNEFIPWNKGTKGLTTCPEHQKEINRQMMIERYNNGLCVKGANNPRAKTWKITYQDGKEIIIGALQRWALNNGYSRSGVKNLAYRKWKKYKDLVSIEEVSQDP